MAQRPSFGSLKKAKPGLAVVEETPPERPPPAAKPARIQTSIRLEPAVWGALNDLATRKRVETGERTTVLDLITEGVMHILAVNGVKIPGKQGSSGS
jgi:hypothetical protein